MVEGGRVVGLRQSSEVYGVRGKALRRVLKEDEPDVMPIIEHVAKAYNLLVEQIRSQRKTAKIALARQIAMYLTRELTNLSFPEIGFVFNRDHSTAVHAWQVIGRRVAGRPIFASEIGKLRIALTVRVAA